MPEKTPKKTEEKPEEKTAFSNGLMRFLAVLICAGIGVYYLYFNKPAEFVFQDAAGQTMGTDYAVKVADVPKYKRDTWKNVKEAVQKRLDDIDKAVSFSKPDSDVFLFNASESSDWFPVSRDTAEIVRTALEVSKLTNGAFDIVEQPLANVKAYSTYKNLEVRLEPPSLKKSDIALSINVSAIAKGYAVDSVARLLDEFKFEHYLVEVGSEVRCKGSKSKEEKWIIGIEAPLPVTAEQFPGLQKELPFPALSMATSSDNKTASLLGSVSVFDTDCVRADALAAAMSVLGEQKGLELAEKHGLAVLYLLRSENQDQTIREASSVKFKKLFP